MRRPPSAGKCPPDRVIGLNVTLLERILLQPQRLGEPRVVRPVDFDHHAVGGRLEHETLVGLVGLKLGVEADPDAAAGLSDGRYQDIPRQPADRLRFLTPTNIHSLERFDIADVVAQAGEGKLRAVLTPDRGLGDLIEPQQAQRFNLVAEQLVDRILDAGLELASAENAQRRLGAKDKQGSGNAPRLSAAAPAVEYFVAGRLK